ncbi:Multidrug efflux pump subunit AcrB [Sphaerochaeta associata]|uniref:Efflux RND transporter permease subunit n=1 Tax=Sphaerochaeta associata TaxID=1129264 RepID=A0ABY4D601_9SPIR|nr:efflux RND transporter permease subunit [Sphaerochaeta associata]UOM49713.1 efflux RND transporter permease subunit [Sphaerochaeta associata]SMP48449.1 Multidrug efflux pump subunit AcrB [Sphaerochaeta associata]
MDDNISRFTIGKFSVTKPVLINILMITVLALGLFSLISLPQEQFAEVPFYWVNVIVPYPGVAAEDMEASVTIPVENAFQGMDRLKQISSTTSEGLSVVRVEFDDGIDDQLFKALFQDAQTRFSQVTLPDGTLPAILDDFSSSDFLPVVEVIISGNLPYQELREQALALQNEILKVGDVADVQIIGLPERQIQVQLDPTMLASLGLSVNEVVRSISEQNRSVPSGNLTTQSREYLIRTLGSIREVDDINSVIVRRSNQGEGIIRVSDVAQVVDGFEKDTPFNRFNGSPSVSLRVTKVVKGNSVAIVDRVRSIVEEQQQISGAKMTLFNDSTVQIASSLSVLSSNALMGLALLVIILGLFIGVRNSLITALGIPVTFALTFLVLDLLGETINTNTLFGLVLVLGLIVDHGIVIIENSYRLQTLGLKRHEAAILGVNQVIWPVIAATGTTVAAFLPLMIIPGTIGKFLRVIPLTVTIALIVSTFEALFFLPSHYAEWGPRERNIVRKPKKDRFGIFVGRYRMFLENLYNRKGLYLVILLLITVGVFSLVGTLKQDLFSAEDYSYFNIEITTPLGSTLDQTNRIVQSYEEVLLGKVGNGEILSISSNIGGSGNSQTTTQAQITVDLAEKDQGRQRSIEAIIDELKRETYYLSGSEQVLFTKAQTGPPTSADFSFRLSGDSYQPIINAAAALSNALASIENVSNVQSDFVPGNPVLRVEVNQDQASRLGISVSTIAGYLRSRFDGVTVGTFFLENEEIDIIAQFAAKSADRFEDLEQILIPTDDLRLVPLSSVATIKLDNSIGSIRRVEGKREITITADASGDVDQKAVNSQIRQLWDTQLEARYAGVDLVVGGEFADFSNLLIDILRVFVLGIFLMYLILGAQFNSYSQPFLILLSVPFAFIGVVLYLFVSGTPLSTTVIYSAVALAGVAVNDAIVLISFINDLRSEGKSVREAVFESAVTRIRPILLTSLTTIAGLLPTAIGIGGYSVVWSPMASTIMVGLVFSTLSALLIIPLLYGVLYDRKPRSAA